MTALFVVGTGPQADSARRVSAHLSRPAEILDIEHATVVPVGEYASTSHSAAVSVGRLRAVAAAVTGWARRNPGGVLVAPQDVGLVYRRIVAVARRRGLRIGFLPDGAVSDARVTPNSLKGGLVPAADVLLRSTGFVAGKHGRMAASRPDLVLSWGPGWNRIYASVGATNVVDAGNPRADDLDAIPAPPDGGPVLICSQPHWHPSIGGDEALAAWYDVIERVVSDAPAGQVAVRLHPWEWDRYDEMPIGEATRAVLTRDTSLHTDLGAAAAVVGWASTTLLEAAGAHRPVLSVAVNPAAAKLAASNAFLADPRVLSVPAGSVSGYDDVVRLVGVARDQQAGLADDYLVNVGSAAKACAAALDAL